MIAAQRPKWGGAHAARLVRLTLATFRDGLPPVRPRRRNDRGPHHPALTQRPRHPRQPAPSARPVQPASREPHALGVVRREPATDPLDAHPQTLARLVIHI